MVYRTVSTQAGYPTKMAWYDLLGRPVKQAQAGFRSVLDGSQYAFSATLTQYDENGRTQKQSAPYYAGIESTLYYTEFSHDALNRVTAKTAPAACSGGAMDTSFGRQTNIKASSFCPGDPSNREIRMSRSTNVLGQLMQTVDANNKTTRYWTDALGHVAAIRDVELNVIKASYNELGHRLQSVDPDQGTWSFTYNALGELQTQTDARNVTTTVTARDVLGRVTQRQQISPKGQTGLAEENLLDTWTYDPANGVGQIGTVSRRRSAEAIPSSNAEVWKEQYTYDAASRPSGITTTINEPGSTLSLSSATTYDGVGRVDTQTYPQLPTSSVPGLTVKHTYSAYGQLGALSNAGTGYVYWVAQGQNAWGHLTGEQYPGVITGSHSDYAATGQSQTLSWSGSVSDQIAYTYDGFGNLAKQKRSGAATNTETYAYDNLQRLTQASRAIGDTVNYTYSDSGNITSKSDNGTTNYAYTKTKNCGPHAVTAANGLSYECDANGNVIGGAITAVYDADNHPRSIVRNPAVGAMNWSYSTLGGMTTELSSQGMRYFGPNGYEQTGVGTSAKQVHELGPVVVTRTNGVDSVSVLLRDRLGSTISVIDANSPTTRMYDAFGKARNGDMGNRDNGTLDLDKTIHGFTKHDHADEVRLIHMGGRVYDYQLGRFLNVDPIISNPANSQHLNPYSYIGNNPLSGTDPTGYQQCTGSAIERESCSSPTLSVNQVASPSVSAKNDATAQTLGNAYSNSVTNDINRKQANRVDSMTPSGAQSTPNNGQALSIGSISTGISHFLAPNLTDYVQRGQSGNWGDYSLGIGKGLLNLGIGLGNLSILQNDPFAMYNGTLIPSIPIGGKELGGAATVDAISLGLTALKVGQWAARLGSGTTTLYRAVSAEELKNIASSGGFSPGQASMGNKWFAELASDASAWGKWFFSQDKVPFFTVRVQVPNDLAKQMIRVPKLDNIGPARSAESELLRQINSRAKIDALNGNVVP